MSVHTLGVRSGRRSLWVECDKVLTRYMVVVVLCDSSCVFLPSWKQPKNEVGYAEDERQGCEAMSSR